MAGPLEGGSPNPIDAIDAPARDAPGPLDGAVTNDVTASSETSPRDSLSPDDIGRTDAVIPAIEMMVNVKIWDYGYVWAGKAWATQRFVLTYSGNATAGPVSVTLTSAEYKLTLDRCNGAVLSSSNKSCSVDVLFVPASIGPKAALLQFSFDAGPGISVSLTGNGGVPELTLTPEAATFSAPVSTVSDAVVFAASNVGKVGLPDLRVYVEGSGYADYGIGANACAASSLPAGRSCTFRVTFRPSRSGTSQATVVVSTVNERAILGTATLTGTAQ